MEKPVTGGEGTTSMIHSISWSMARDNSPNLNPKWQLQEKGR